MTRIKSLRELKQSGIVRFRDKATGEVKRIHTIDIRGYQPDGLPIGSVVVIDEDQCSTEVEAQDFRNSLVVNAIDLLPDENTKTATLNGFEKTPTGQA